MLKGAHYLLTPCQAIILKLKKKPKQNKTSAVTEIKSNEKAGYVLQNIYVGIKSQEFRHTGRS